MIKYKYKIFQSNKHKYYIIWKESCDSFPKIMFSSPWRSNLLHLLNTNNWKIEHECLYETEYVTLIAELYSLKDFKEYYPEYFI